MNDDLAQRAARHRPVKTPGGPVCSVCDTYIPGGSYAVLWPCDAGALAVALAAEQAKRIRAEGEKTRLRLTIRAYLDAAHRRPPFDNDEPKWQLKLQAALAGEDWQ